MTEIGLVAIGLAAMVGLTLVYFGTATSTRSRGVQLVALTATAVAAAAAVEGTVTDRSWPMWGQIALPWWAGTYFVNGVITFYVYGYDKRAGEQDQWRVNTWTLWLLTLLGGWPGALVGRTFFGHKTRKLGFTIVTWLLAAANIAFWVWLPGALVR